ncbi:MAG: hypothetical protein IJJ00_05790 [Erysipelotrichaceae bacterium]|nr:hypothetical protein [Erysipelotrichaceae bacterium]
MSEMEFETGISCSNYVTVKIAGLNGETASLSVNPIGQFNPGGCEAMVFIKKDDVLALKTVDELYAYLLRKIFIENLETAVEIDDCSLGGVLEYTKTLEENEDNNWWLPYFKKLEKKVDEFHESLTCFAKDLKDIKVVTVHEYHSASGELCDFVDYTCAPEGDENEEIRSYLEEHLSKESDIDAIMDCFEDGYFYGSSFEGDEKTVIDFNNNTFEKTMTVTNVQ